MPKSQVPQGQVMRVLFLDTRGIEVEVGKEEIQLRVPETIPFPFEIFDSLEEWAREAGFDKREAMEFREAVGEYAGRKTDERFLISRLT